MHFHGVVRRRSQRQALDKQINSIKKTNLHYHIFDGAVPMRLSIQHHRVTYIWLKQQSHEPSTRARALLFELHMANSTCKDPLSLRVLGRANTNNANPIKFNPIGAIAPLSTDPPSAGQPIARRHSALPPSPPRPPRPPRCPPSCAVCRTANTQIKSNAFAVR